MLDGNTVVDRSNGRDVRLPQSVYYALGQIDHLGNVHKYSMEEMRRKILDSGHWGPWDLQTESGL